MPLNDIQQGKSLALLQNWLMVIGGGFVLIGGAVAAVASPLDLAKGSWLSAYLVLVAGVPVYLIGQLIPHWICGRGGWSLLAGWNLGNAAVIAGSLMSLPLLVDVGGVVLLIPLGYLLWIAMRRKAAVEGEGTSVAIVGRWLLIAALIILIVSVPIGLILAHMRA
ncbi:hypothetical protein ACG98H_04875 [Corynebacterium sp. L4756]|uniref:hypothetical protein n=1 Tax=unclassified Corynebacterium TaxID=2624378 RepID=UPI00374D11AA